jgi:hypothetical protein
MADRTSAEVFGNIFRLLAKKPTKDHKQLAQEIYDMTWHYDFNEYQMGLDDELDKLEVQNREEQDDD